MNNYFQNCTSWAWTGQDCNSSTSEQSSVSAKDGVTRKRKASPDQKTPRKKTRVSETGPLNTSGQVPTMRLGKRKSREDGEGPSHEGKDKKRRTDPLEVETASTSMDETKHTCGAEKTKKSKKVAFFRRLATFLQRKTKPTCEAKKTKKINKVDIFNRLGTFLQKAQFEAKYQEHFYLGEGGCGSVLAGFRKEDNLPVAIKHIPKENVLCKHVDKNGKEVPAEVTIMLKLAAGHNGSVGTSAPVSLLDWYDLDQEVILVLERPVPAMDLNKYITFKEDNTEEEEAKVILKQLVNAAIELQDQKIFHRDIKLENILIETGSDVPRARLIDFGLSCFAERESSYSTFYGTLLFASPEWFQTGTYSAGPTTVWQLGVVLFEMLHKGDGFETNMFLKNELEISAELSENCQDFLRACLDEDPQQRPTLEQLHIHPWLR